MQIPYRIRCLPIAFLLMVIFATESETRAVARRDPLDGALDATLIVLVRKSHGVLRVEETFLGDLDRGATITIPDFKLVVEDTSTPVCCSTKEEPITAHTWILVYLKPAAGNPSTWEVAGFGNCYFFVHRADKIDALRQTALESVAYRNAWNAAVRLRDPQQRAKALWPLLWIHESDVQFMVLRAFLGIGAVAGDYFADRLPNMSRLKKSQLSGYAHEIQSDKLHTAFLSEFTKEQQQWEQLSAGHGHTTFDAVLANHPGSADARRAIETDQELSNDLRVLKGFDDRGDLEIFRRSALWGVRYRFTSLCDAVLEIFEEMPDEANLPAISAIWQEFSTRPFPSRPIRPFDIVRALAAHHFPAAIPMMIPFVPGDQLAQHFLRDMTGQDFGDNPAAWKAWYEAQH